MKIFKIDYYFKVHFFWTALLLLVNYQMNRSIAKYNLYDFEFSRPSIAGIRMAFLYFTNKHDTPQGKSGL